MNPVYHLESSMARIFRQRCQYAVTHDNKLLGRFVLEQDAREFAIERSRYNRLFCEVHAPRGIIGLYVGGYAADSYYLRQE